ncbi:hypothetical protein MABM_25740 [Mycobacteroides abscessus]|nr:hypothetical protein MABM_25740 [Mycobacteroides abscessus]
MADTSDLHPAVLHALRTGDVGPAQDAAKLNASTSTARRAQGSRNESASGATKQPPPTALEEDDFYQNFRSNPLGRR